VIESGHYARLLLLLALLATQAFGQWQEMPVPIVAGHPFSADEVTPRKLSPNLTSAVSETSRVYRDSAGRTRIDVPLPRIPGRVPLPVIIDPVANVIYILNTDKNTASRSIYSLVPGQAVPTSDDPWKPPTAMGIYPLGFPLPTKKSEFLPVQLIDGFTAAGRRITMIFAAGTVGGVSQAAQESVEEDWYSQELQMMVLKQMHTTGSGDSTTRLENINRAEPDPLLFQVPADYTIIDLPGSQTAKPN
jgi:hypothetical protein